jgi:hypothetical protein
MRESVKGADPARHGDVRRLEGRGRHQAMADHAWEDEAWLGVRA